jgi:glycosyltransferase involved in cell wall biosynthesis
MISILMPVFNAMPYLLPCLDSILAQTEEDWELLVVDDHSTDEGRNLLEDYALMDRRIKPLLNPEKGIVSALRLAFRHAQGEYITRMDADDLMEPSKLQDLRNALLGVGQGYISTSKIKYFSDAGDVQPGYQRYENWLNALMETNTHRQELYKECPIPSPNWMTHRNDLILAGAFDSDYFPDDYDLTFRFFKAGMKIVTVNKVLHHWRDHASRTTRMDIQYANPYFLELKINYFLQIDFKPNQPLILWGAGKKGKMCAKLLIASNISFSWITDTPTKIGHFIYDIKLESSESIKTQINPQIIVAIGAPDELISIKNRLSNINARAFYIS